MAKRCDPVEYAALNPGIRLTVRWLREQGFETDASGDGVTHECACDAAYPFVTLQVRPAKRLVKETRRLVCLLAALGFTLGGWNEDGAPEGVVVDASYFPVLDDAVIQLAGVDDAALVAAPRAGAWGLLNAIAPAAAAGAVGAR